jgi:hypothetical protein
MRFSLRSKLPGIGFLRLTREKLDLALRVVGVADLKTEFEAARVDATLESTPCPKWNHCSIKHGHSGVSTTIG